MLLIYSKIWHTKSNICKDKIEPLFKKTRMLLRYFWTNSENNEWKEKTIGHLVISKWGCTCRNSDNAL